MDISDREILSAFPSLGLHRFKHKRVFYTPGNDLFAPAIAVDIIRNKLGIRIGGSVGLLFFDFEDYWSNKISYLDRKIDNSLPITLNLSNFHYFLDENYFDYLNDNEDVNDRICAIHSLLEEMPTDCVGLEVSLSLGLLCGKPLVDFLHIRQGVDPTSLYFRKSVEFFSWSKREFPNLYAMSMTHLPKSTTRYLS